MIFWKGFGILALIIPIGIAILFQLIFGDSSMFTGIGYAIGGILIWVLGKRLNSNNERIILDPKTGQQAVQKLEHSLFWIRMELWAPIFILLGLLFSISNLTSRKSEEFAFPIIGVVLILTALYTLYENKNNLKLALSSNPTQKSDKSTSILSDIKKKESKLDYLKTRPTSSSMRSQSKIALTEKEKEKKLFYEELRNNKNKEFTFKPTDNSRYMPKKPNLNSE